MADHKTTKLSYSNSNLKPVHSWIISNHNIIADVILTSKCIFYVKKIWNLSMRKTVISSSNRPWLTSTLNYSYLWCNEEIWGVVYVVY